MKYGNRSALVLIGVCIVVACGDGDGDDGGSTIVIPGVITTTSEIAKGDVCSAGGILIQSGVDEDGDNALSSDEVSDSYNVCNGTSGMAVDGPSGDDGPAGGAGNDGSDGQDGAMTLSTSVAASSSVCPTGGTLVSFGPDIDGSGILDAGEVSSTTTICNGLGGGDACAPVIKITPVSPGTLCSTGGVLVEYGTDSGVIGAGGAANGGAGGVTDSPMACDGLLDPGEEVASELVCNGPPGAPGMDGTNGSDGSDGSDGTNGSDGIDGIDGVDGTNGNDGSDGNDGTNGTSMAVRLTVVAAGNATCINGGMLLESGIDDNANSVLELGEVDNQSYSCF